MYCITSPWTVTTSGVTTGSATKKKFAGPNPRIFLYRVVILLHFWLLLNSRKRKQIAGLIDERNDFVHDVKMITLNTLDNLTGALDLLCQVAQIR